jgi:hypothetical protein
MIKSLLLHGTIFLTLLSALSAQSPVPSINQPLLPAATTPGGPQFTLTVNGTGFVSGSVVDWNDSALATTFVNGSQLTASVSALDIASAFTAWVTGGESRPRRRHLKCSVFTGYDSYSNR